MASIAFTKALTATGYLLPNGEPSPGLARTGEDAGFRLRPILTSGKVGLEADAVFSAQNTPTSIFKDAGEQPPTEYQISKWHEAAWNVGLAPLLWIITPTEIRLYDCYSSPIKDGYQEYSSNPLDVFAINVIEQLISLDEMCGRFATETGAFWSSPIGKRIDRRYRVDRELLGEISALENLLSLVPPADLTLTSNESESADARDFAQRLIGRCIFTSYLIDRGIAQPFLPSNFPATVSDMFATVDSTFKLFEWLRNTFNGDLFPMDNPGAEHQRLGNTHLSLLQEFVQGRSLLSGQGRLFRFRYDAIPVDLISSIYQQFARASASDKAHMQGLHYTPVELVHLTLDPVFESLPAQARIIDPTCGSGAFLVEAFRRLVWKNSKGQPANRALVREILYKQLYGIDINKSALGVAAFSLYLAALELDEQPIDDILDLKFDRLIGTTLFEADTVNDELPALITARSFDAVVGNPPWTFVRQENVERKRVSGNDLTTRPRRSPDQEFLWVAARLSGENGRIGMIMKASPFFSKDQHAVDARIAILSKLSPAALINLSSLRKEELFPDASGPALLFFARCALMEKGDRILLGSIPWTPDFRRNGVFNVGPGEFKSLPLSRVLRTPSMLKAATFGTVRDGWLIEKLERSFPTFEKLLDDLGLVTRGQGFKVNGNVMYESPATYFKLRILNSVNYTPFRVDSDNLDVFQYKNLHRLRNPSIFKGPLLICPKGMLQKAAELGRYSATYINDDALFTESFFGISFDGVGSKFAKIISGILNSSIVSFQLAFGGSTWGLERPTVGPADLLSLRLPNLLNADPDLLKAVEVTEKDAASNPGNSDYISALDAAVFELYDLERDEGVIASESVKRARILMFDGYQQRISFIKPPNADALREYAHEVVHTVNSYLRARGERHLEAVIYTQRVTKGNLNDGTPGLTAVKFIMVLGEATPSPIIHQCNDKNEQLAIPFQGQAYTGIPPYLNERRQLRIYSNNDLFILKPSENRYWTKTAGLNDADIILADHWIKGQYEFIH